MNLETLNCTERERGIYRGKGETICGDINLEIHNLGEVCSLTDKLVLPTLYLRISSPMWYSVFTLCLRVDYSDNSVELVERIQRELFDISVGYKMRKE